MRHLLGLLCCALSFASQAHQDPPHATATTTTTQPNVVETPFGRSGDAAQVTRTLHITMRDTLRFEPNAITVRQGETVRLVAHNEGQGLHELVLGRAEELQAHAALMRKFPNMEHDEPFMAHVAPGQQGDIVWQFTAPGTYQFACLVAGHFEAGMVGRITVLAQNSSPPHTPDEHAGHHATSAASDTVLGEVRRINREQNKITLRHGPLTQLSMPAMTMVFAVSEPRLLDGLKVGDKVRFTVQQNADGNLVITQVQPAP